MKLLILILTALLDIVPSGDATLQQLQKRDSILIADQIRYGVTIEDVKAGEKIALPDFSAASNDTLTILAGSDLPDKEFENLVERLEEALPDFDIDQHRGDQPLYPVVFSIE